MQDQGKIQRDVQGEVRVRGQGQGGVRRRIPYFMSGGPLPGITVECSDALLEGQQALVDLSTLESRLAVVVEGVGAAFASSEIDE